MTEKMVMSGEYSENARIVTEGWITVIIDPLDRSSVRITVMDRRTKRVIMKEAVSAADSHSEQESTAS